MKRDAAYVAQQIGKSENWMRRNARRYPHHRAGQTYFWTDEDIADILAMTRVRPDGEPTPGLRPVARGRRAS